MQGLGSTWSFPSSFINMPEKALGKQETSVNQNPLKNTLILSIQALLWQRNKHPQLSKCNNVAQLKLYPWAGTFSRITVYWNKHAFKLMNLHMQFYVISFVVGKGWVCKVKTENNVLGSHFWGSNPDYQAWQASHLPTESSHPQAHKTLVFCLELLERQDITVNRRNEGSGPWEDYILAE